MYSLMRQSVLYFIFMAEGANQGISEMSLPLHRIVIVLEAHAAPLRLREHSKVSFHLSALADRREQKHVASVPVLCLVVNKDASKGLASTDYLLYARHVA